MNCRGANLNDSMAEAIENAACIVVFMSAKYKESANCRKECEYADGQQTPIVYVMVEENYKPNGWLGIQLGKTVYVYIPTEQRATEQIDVLCDKIRPHMSPSTTPSINSNQGRVPAPSSSPASASTKASSASSNTGNSNADILKMLTEMNQKIEDLTERLAKVEGKLSE